ncbi:hypothetical protein C2G38_2254233 [Gigaspora rosea]|uniref:Uncharacterized protein n=1 Tax=Gigaspora rosea TaxID=44941 RepID=A0A397U4Y5_9GLOM|nr:hypothetical protein C2G38_2254233 [Gigaspora rosea]CAG8542250.1 208_t:CDS:2 [Gigaspora rosea]
MYAENQKLKETEKDESESIIQRDSPIPTRSSLVRNSVEHLEYLAEREKCAPQGSKYDRGLSDNQDQPIELSSPLGKHPTYLSNPGIIEQYITQPYIPQTIETSLPLSPLDEVQNKMADLQTVPSHQITISSNNLQFQNASIGMTEVTAHLLSEQENIDHSSILTLPGVTMTKNRSRINTPTIENIPRIKSGYTAQIQTSNTPLRQEFRKSDIVSPTHFQQLQLQNRHSDIPTSSLGNTSSINSILQTETSAALGDPDDPLLNNQKNSPNNTRSIIPYPQQLDPHYPHQLQNNVNEDPRSSLFPSMKAATPLLNSKKNGNGYKPKGLIICLCFSIVAGIIFTLWAITNFMPNKVTTAGNKNPRQQLPTNVL